MEYSHLDQRGTSVPECTLRLDTPGSGAHSDTNPGRCRSRPPGSPGERVDLRFSAQFALGQHRRKRGRRRYLRRFDRPSATGNVVDRIPIGSEPGASGSAKLMMVSHLFAALGGAPAIATIDLATKQSSSFSVLDTSNSLYWTATALAAIGGQSNSVVAVRVAAGPSNSSVIAYDAGTPRTNTFNSGQGANLYQQWVQAIYSGRCCEHVLCDRYRREPRRWYH